MKQLAVDLVILNERPRPMRRICSRSLEALVRMNRSMPRPGGDARAERFSSCAPT